MANNYYNSSGKIRHLMAKQDLLRVRLHKNEEIMRVSRQLPESAEDDPFELDKTLKQLQTKPFRERFLEERKKISVPADLKIKVVTFNVMGKSLVGNSSAIFSDSAYADIYAIGLQEIVEMKASAIASVMWTGTITTLNQWNNNLLKSLPGETTDYETVVCKNLVGLALFVYVRKEIFKHLSDVEIQTIPLGVFRTIGNKGSIGVRLTVMNSTICFVTSHFSAGKQNIEDRNSDFHFSVDKMDFNLDKWTIEKGISLFNSDTVIWFGDLNYRINLNNATHLHSVHGKIISNDFAFLTQNDQLNQQMEQNNVFHGFFEGEIDFQPTYKYIPGSRNAYDCSGEEKQRMPAWCDRILFKSEQLQLRRYSDIKRVAISDHKPVFADFVMRAEYLDCGKKKRLISSLEKGISRIKRDLRPRIELSPTEIDLKDLYFGVKCVQRITVTNVGKSETNLSVFTQWDQNGARWIRYPKTTFGLPLLSSQTIEVFCLVDKAVATRLDLASGNPLLTGKVIFEPQKGSPFEVKVKATYLRSFMGCSLDLLCSIKEPIRFSTQTDETTKKGVCPQIEAMVRFILRSGTAALCWNNFDKIDHKEILRIRERIDKGEPIPENSDKMHVMFLLLQMLCNLPTPIFKESFLVSFNSANNFENWFQKILMEMNPMRRVNFLQVTVLLQCIMQSNSTVKLNHLVVNCIRPVFGLGKKHLLYSKAILFLTRLIKGA